MANPEDSDFFSADLSAGTPVTGKVYTGGLADINPTAQNKAAIAPLDVNMNTPITQRGSALPPMANHESIVSALDFMRNNHQAEVINPMQGAKSFEFGASMDHMSFERYYQHGLYDELGFNAARDNESLYNENTSLSMEMGRAAGQWGSQFRLGMMDAFGFGGVTDQSAARMMEQNMAIGSSSVGGVTGFMTNQFLNTGYTFGILGELGLEYLAELGVTALTGGAAAPATGAAAVARTGRSFWKIKNAYQATRNLAKTLASLKDMSKAKKYFTQAAKSTGRFLNPLENTTDFIRNAGKLEDFREMNNLAKTSSGFLSFYKDVRNARIAFGESSLEGGMVQNEMIGDLYDEFVHTHGRDPNEAEVAAIRDTAAKAGATTTWANLPTIFFSNKIVLDRAFTKMNPFKKVGSDLLEKGAAGKLMFNRKAAKDAFEVVENNWKGFLKTARNPRAYGNVGMNYFKANFAEGLQEVAQEVIAGSSKDYYTAQFEGTPLKGGAWAALSDNVSKQFSGQGFETFMSGFLMGGMIQPVTMAPSYLKAGVSRFKDPAKYKAQKAEGMAELNKKANILNEMFNDPLKYFNQDLANTEAQHKYDKAAEQAEANNDTKAYHDIKDAGLYDHVYTALRAKRMDTFIERLEDMRSAEEADIKAEYGDLSVEEYQAKIDKSIKRAKEIQARFDFVEKKHTNPFNPSAYEKGSLQYIKSAINHVGWQAAQKEFIFNGHAFDRTLERMSSIMGEANTDLNLKNTSINDFNILFDGTLSQVQAEIDTLGKELDALPEEKLTNEQIKRRKYKSQKRDFLKNYAEAMQGVMETTSGEVGGQVTPEGNKSLKKAYKAFERYLKHVAGENKEYVFDENIQKAFNKLMDYQMLSMDARNLEKAVNMMTSPKAFMERAERLAKQHEDAFAKRDQEIEKALKEWMKVVETNRLLQLLSEINVFFDPKEIKPLLEEGKMPGQFYQLKTKDGGTGIKREIQKNSVQHRKAVNIIKNYVQDIMDIEIPEAEGTSEYQTKTRPKLANDKRTYNDLAEQFGFDPEAESSEVPLAQVLESIINSKFATHREKALAENLLRLAKEGEKVTFVKNSSKPGTYSSTEQTVIDARYNSREYRNAGTPIEFIILHEEIHRRTVEGLSEDADFRRSIKSLMAAVDQFMSAPENQAKYGSKPYYGMKNPAEFVAEAMANQEFQTLLSEISYADQNRTGSTWTNFVDEVLKFFRRMFGRKADGTVMNAAFDIITTKIDSDFGAPTALQLDQAKVKRIEAARKAELDPLLSEIEAIEKEIAEIEQEGIQGAYDFTASSNSGKWNNAKSSLEAAAQSDRKAMVYLKVRLGEAKTFKEIVDEINARTNITVEYTSNMRRADETMSAEEIESALNSYNDSVTNIVENKAQVEKDVLTENGLQDEQEYTPEELIEKFPLTGVQKVIWDLIKNVVSELGIKVKFSSSRITEGFDGGFNPTTGEIMIRPSAIKSGRIGEVLVHEVVHALTTKIINRVNSGVTTGLSAKQIKAVQGLMKLYESVKADNNLQNDYPVKDPFEFIAHLTNEAFVKELESKDKNFLNKVVDFILDILGITNANELTKKYLLDIISDGVFLQEQGVTVVSSDYGQSVQGSQQERLQELKNKLKALKKQVEKVNAKYDKQIEELKAAAAQQAIPEAGGTSTEPQILPTTPFAEIKDQHPELMKQLVQAYKDDNAALERRGLEPHEENWEMMSDEQIMASGFFRNTFIKRLSPARKVFTAYNRTTGRTAAPVTPSVQTPTAPPVAPLASSQTVSDEEYQAFVDTGAVSEARIDSIAKKIKAGTQLNERETAIFTDKTAEVNSRIAALAQIEAADIPTQWNRALKQQVLDLGYTEEERRAMDVSDAWVLVQEGLTKEERNEIELADQNAARAELEEQRQSILTRIDEEIASAENYEELLAVEAELLAEFASNPQLRAAAGLTGPAIEAKIQAKKDELAFNFTFEDFVVGETVIMNNRARTKVKIDRIENDIIFGTNINDATKRYKIRRGTETQRVKYKHSRAMAESTVTPETVTPESTELSNETIETGRGLNNQESIQEDIAAGRDATDEDLDSDLLDDVNECE